MFKVGIKILLFFLAIESKDSYSIEDQASVVHVKVEADYPKPQTDFEKSIEGIVPRISKNVTRLMHGLNDFIFAIPKALGVSAIDAYKDSRNGLCSMGKTAKYISKDVADTVENLYSDYNRVRDISLGHWNTPEGHKAMNVLVASYLGTASIGASGTSENFSVNFTVNNNARAMLWLGKAFYNSATLPLTSSTGSAALTARSVNSSTGALLAYLRPDTVLHSLVKVSHNSAMGIEATSEAAFIRLQEFPNNFLKNSAVGLDTVSTKVGQKVDEVSKVLYKTSVDGYQNLMKSFRLEKSLVTPNGFLNLAKVSANITTSFALYASSQTSSNSSARFNLKKVNPKDAVTLLKNDEDYQKFLEQLSSSVSDSVGFNEEEKASLKGKIDGALLSEFSKHKNNFDKYKVDVLAGAGG